MNRGSRPGRGEPRLTADIVLHPAERLRMVVGIAADSFGGSQMTYDPH